ncbi:MAG: sensor histidine kinase, partial [Solirubrobacteraceae bacterium]
MITVLAIAGWAVAAAGGVIALHAHRRLAVWAESIARASHELRGPLTAARLGLSPRPGPLPSESRLAAIDAELCRACVALDDLDEPGRPAPRLRTLERIGIEAFLGCCVEAWQGSAESAGVTLTLALAGPGASVWGDRARLAQAVGNLISNAIEHGGGAVEVRGCVRRGLVRVEVSDRGPGLPAPVAQRCGRARAR